MPIETCIEFLLYEMTHRDTFAWNYRELQPLLTVSSNNAQGGIETLTIRLVSKCNPRDNFVVETTAKA